jgi:hypothetical protein
MFGRVRRLRVLDLVSTVTVSNTWKLGITRNRQACATIVTAQTRCHRPDSGRDTLRVTTRGEDPFKMTAEPSHARDARGVVEQLDVSPELPPPCRALFA